MTRALLVLLLLAAATLGTPRVFADCPCTQHPDAAPEPLDLVFVLDATGSMEAVIGALKERLDRLIVVLEHTLPRLRLGAVIYRTAGDRYVEDRGVDLSANPSDVRRFLGDVTALGGGREDIAGGLEMALTRMTWARAARKAAVLIGDEGEHAATDDELRALVARMRAAGIVLHTITARRAPDLVPLLPDAAQAEVRALDRQLQALYAPGGAADLEALARQERLLRRRRETLIADRYRVLPQAARTGEVLPLFAQLAAEGGGLALGLNREDELLDRLLTATLGPERAALADQPLAAFWERDRWFDDAEFAARRESKRRQLILGQIRSDGDWRAPHLLDEAAPALNARFRLELSPRKKAVALGAEPLHEFPLLLLSGHGPVLLSATARAALRDYLHAGGFVFADACCGDREFADSLRTLVLELFPDRTLQPLTIDHALYSFPNDCRSVTARAQPHTGKLGPRTFPLELLTLDAGPALLLTPWDLGCALARAEGFETCQLAEREALALFANVLFFALGR